MSEVIMQESTMKKLFEMAKSGKEFEDVLKEAARMQKDFEKDIEEIPAGIKKVLNSAPRIIKDNYAHINRQWQMDEKIKFIVNEFYKNNKLFNTSKHLSKD